MAPTSVEPASPNPAAGRLRGRARQVSVKPIKMPRPAVLLSCAARLRLRLSRSGGARWRLCCRESVRSPPVGGGLPELLFCGVPFVRWADSSLFAAFDTPLPSRASPAAGAYALQTARAGGGAVPRDVCCCARVTCCTEPLHVALRLHCVPCNAYFTLPRARGLGEVKRASDPGRGVPLFTRL